MRTKQVSDHHAGMSALEAGMIGCGDCELVVDAHGHMHQHLRCPRCGATLQSRKPNSVARTWALLIAALVFYIPANVLPITTVLSLGNAQSDTIMSGVIYFMQSGSWEIALVIFVASVFVPLMKILILVFLLLSVQRNLQWRPREQAKLYRLTEIVGKWSMVDVYVVTILVALVNLGAIANIDAGPAAIYFAAVVLLTMFAARTFDPRLIWDTVKDNK
jgi:paraquat-inducible protein A